MRYDLLKDGIKILERHKQAVLQTMHRLRGDVRLLGAKNESYRNMEEANDEG